MTIILALCALLKVVAQLPANRGAALHHIPANLLAAKYATGAFDSIGYAMQTAVATRRVGGGGVSCSAVAGCELR
jgi:hypothetical protein